MQIIIILRSIRKIRANVAAAACIALLGPFDPRAGGGINFEILHKVREETTLNVFPTIADLYRE
jgi:hypothetical protein